MASKSGLKCGIGSLHCAILPAEGEVLTSNSFAVADTAVRCADSSFKRIDQFPFKKVYKSFPEFASSSFHTVVAPLVKKVLSGETATCIFGGPASFQMQSYLLSQQNMHGHLSDAANMILQAVHREELVSGSRPKLVTFSWFRIDCSANETITDVCNPHHKELMFRDLGNGRGMEAIDVAEVEITSGEDVDTIVKTALQTIASANHSAGNAHTVMQIKITPRQSGGRQSSLKSGAGKLLDSKGTGRLTFFLLSNLSSQRQLMANDSNVGMYPWAEKIPQIMDWLDSKRASPPFHRSRLLLFLRDALSGRQSSSFLLLLHPTIDYLQSNYLWLSLCQRMGRDTIHGHLQTTSIAGPAYIFGSNPSSPSASSRLITADSLEYPHESDREVASKGFASAAAPVKDRYQTYSEKASSTGKRSQPPQPPVASMSFGDPFPVREVINGTMSGKEVSSPFGTAVIVDSDDEHAEGGGEFFQDMPADMQNANTLLAELHEEIEFTGKRTTPTNRSPNRAQINLTVQTSNQVDDMNYEPLNTGRSAATKYSSSVRHSEAELILIASLEISKRECEQLRQKLATTQEKLTLCESSYDSLMNQLRAEGSLLIKKEQERFKKCLQDLKDYEVYKRVMEAAMVRVQKQMDELVKENESLRSNNNSSEYTIRKQKSVVHKTTKEVVKGSDRIQELEQRTSSLQAECKKLSKEREVAVASLAQAKSEAARSVGQLSAEVSNRTADNKELTKRLSELESRLHAVEEDKAQVEDILTQEVEDLRRAHGKALEMLMSYQEENDLLRSAVSKMAEDAKAAGHPSEDSTT